MIQQHLDKIREIVNTDIDPALWEICQGILREVRAIETIVREQKPVERTMDMNTAVRKVLKHHGLTKVGDGVVEADLISAVLVCLPKQSHAEVVPDWVKYDATNRILIIKGQRYAEELFDHDTAFAQQKANESRPKTCPNKFRPDGTYSGCQLHNLHCAYPNCEK